MSQLEKILINILSGVQDENISFIDLCSLLDFLGFSKRIKGSHHIFYKEKVEEIINIQPNGAKAKPYQIKQVRNIIVRYKLGGKKDA